MQSAVQSCSILMTLLVACLGFVNPGGVCAAEAEVDVAKSCEVTVGTNRVVLLSISRFTEYVSGGDGKGPRVVTSLRVLYLTELGDQPIGTIQAGADLFAAGTNDSVIRNAAGVTGLTSHTNENYAGYVERMKRTGPERAAARLPQVTDAGKAVVVGVTFDDVRLSTRKVDVRVKVGTVQGEEDRVLFKNVDLE